MFIIHNLESPTNNTLEKKPQNLYVKTQNPHQNINFSITRKLQQQLQLHVYVKTLPALIKYFEILPKIFKLSSFFDLFFPLKSKFHKLFQDFPQNSQRSYFESENITNSIELEQRGKLNRKCIPIRILETYLDLTGKLRYLFLPAKNQRRRRAKPVW